MRYIEHWEKYWLDYENIRPNAAKNIKFQCALKLLPSEFKNLLDIGGGNGFFVELIRKNRYSVDFTVIDGSQTAVEKCREKNINSIYYDFDGNPLPFKDNSFDVVTCLDVLEHLHYPWKLLEEMKRVSKRYIIISCPNFASIVNRVDVALGRPPRFMADKHGNQTHGGHIQFITFNTLKYQIEKIGLKITEHAVQDTLFGMRIPFVLRFKKLFPNIFGTLCIKVEKVNKS